MQDRFDGTRLAALKQAFVEQRLSRRDFAKALTALGFGAAAAEVLITATMRDASASEPKRGGRLRVALTTAHAGDTLDPAAMVNDTDIARSGALYSRLIDFLPWNGGLSPALATEWESNADATEWHIRLRRDVEFHNGKTLTSADVVYTINRLRDPATASAAQAYTSDIDEIVSDGPESVVFRMKQSNADLPFLLTEYHFVMLPEGAAEFPRDAVGTGPWKLGEFEPGMYSVFERHPNYYREGLPYLDEVEIFSIPDNFSRLNALHSGEIDLMSGLEASMIEGIDDGDRVTVMSIASGAHPTYAMASNAAPFEDNNIRIALKNAFDRERYLDMAFRGYGVTAADHPIPPHDPFFCAEVPVPQADPDKVAFHLRKAGAENMTFELYTSDTVLGGSNAAVVLAELMRENGVDVSVQRVPSDGFWSAVWMQKPWVAGLWYGRPTADLILSPGYLSDAPWNEGRWKNERFDSLVHEARGTLDEALRREIYCDIQWLLHDEGPSTIPVMTNWIDAHGVQVKDLRPHPHGYIGWMYWDEVWLDG